MAVPGVFQARVLAARLGADGVVAQLRGGVDGPYPMGPVLVYVPEDEVQRAEAILSSTGPDDPAGPGDAAALGHLATDGDPPSAVRRRSSSWALLAGLVAVLLVLFDVLLRVF